MRKNVKNIATAICSMIMAIALVFGFTSLTNSAKADESLTTSTIVLENGASLKIDAEDPALIFTARVDALDTDASYGVLVVEEALLVSNSITGDYFERLAELGLAYEKIICTPFAADDAHRIKAYFSVEEENLAVDYAAIAFIEKADNYVYTDLTANNVRSVEYVAQMALRHESFSAEDEAVLKGWAEGEGDGYFDGNESTNGSVTVNPDNTVASINVDRLNCPGDNTGATIVSFITSTYYCGGSTVEFDIYVPIEVKEYYESQGKGFENCWITVCWTDDLSSTDMYAHVNGFGQDVNSQITPGEWSHVSLIIPGESNVYVYISSAKGEWNGNHMLIDNFTVTEDGVSYVEDFEGEVELIDIHGNPNYVVEGESAPILPEEIVTFVNVPYNIVISPRPEEEEPINGEFSAKIIIDNINYGEDVPASFITKDAYSAGTEVSFMYYVDENATIKDGTWLKVCVATDPTKTSIYSGWVADIPVTRGQWLSLSFTMPSDGCIYIAGAALEWGAQAGNPGEGFILIDDFKVGDVTETFNQGLKASIFNVNTPDAVELADGYIAPAGPEFPGEYSMKYIFNVSGETVSQITANAYAGGSTVSFKYFIPEGTSAQWWGLVYTTSNTGLDIYAAADSSKAFMPGATLGQWTTVEFTLPAGGPYYLYFGSEVGNWKLNGSDAYVLIDDFTV
ncbi:MAG: hypothetical protein IKA61_05815, partial [Clostridia bacterium]|nr:hypothetical protein [Clostridia bacterium]